MKRILIIAAFLLLIADAIGQEKGTWDLGIGGGILTSNEFLKSTEDIIENGTFQNTSVLPGFNLTLKNAVGKNWFIYGEIVYQTINEDLYVEDLVVGDVAHSYITGGFGTEFHYISRDWFQMYSGASIAYTNRNSSFSTTSPGFEDSSEGYFNFHVNALGFRLGRALAATLELGVGYKGVANLGISYQF